MYLNFCIISKLILINFNYKNGIYKINTGKRIKIYVTKYYLNRGIFIKINVTNTSVLT